MSQYNDVQQMSLHIGNINNSKTQAFFQRTSNEADLVDTRHFVVSGVQIVHELRSVFNAPPQI